MPSVNPKNIAIGVLGAAVVGLGSVVAVDHLAASPAPAAATTTAANLAFSPTGAGFGRLDRMGGGDKLFMKIAKDIGVPIPTVFADLKKGETLAQIAGANTGKVEADILSAVQTELNRAESSGAISAAQETRLLNDARDAVSVLMNAKLGDLHLGRH
jgi:hypothetical protein